RHRKPRGQCGAAPCYHGHDTRQSWMPKLLKIKRFGIRAVTPDVTPGRVTTPAQPARKLKRQRTAIVEDRGGRTMALGVQSEVGRLRRVLVHRPGLEHTRLTPSNAEDLLFDDVLWVSRAKQEHDVFCDRMRERGVEVFEIERLLAEALSEPGVRDWACEHILSEREVGIGAADRGRDSVSTAEASLVAEFLIGGITRADIAQDVGLVWESADPTSMLLPPLPNFLFQRDPSCWIYGGVTLNPMTKPARRPETMIMEIVYPFHPMFPREEFHYWLGVADRDLAQALVEGGDVQPDGNSAV